MSVLKEIVEMYQVQSGDPASPSPVPSTCYVVQGIMSLHPQVHPEGRRSQRTDDLRAEAWHQLSAWPVFAQAAGKLCHLPCFVCSLSFCRV